MRNDLHELPRPGIVCVGTWYNQSGYDAREEWHKKTLHKPRLHCSGLASTVVAKEWGDLAFIEVHTQIVHSKVRNTCWRIVRLDEMVEWHATLQMRRFFFWRQHRRYFGRHTSTVFRNRGTTVQLHAIYKILTIIFSSSSRPVNTGRGYPLGTKPVTSSEGEVPLAWDTILTWEYR